MNVRVKGGPLQNKRFCRSPSLFNLLNIFPNSSYHIPNTLVMLFDFVLYAHNYSKSLQVLYHAFKLMKLDLNYLLND